MLDDGASPRTAPPASQAPRLGMRECGRPLRLERLLVEVAWFGDESEIGDAATVIANALVSDFDNAAIAIDTLSSEEVACTRPDTAEPAPSEPGPQADYSEAGRVAGEEGGA